MASLIRRQLAKLIPIVRAPYVKTKRGLIPTLTKQDLNARRERQKSHL